MDRIMFVLNVEDLAMCQLSVQMEVIQEIRITRSIVQSFNLIRRIIIKAELIIVMKKILIIRFQINLSVLNAVNQVIYQPNVLKEVILEIKTTLTNQTISFNQIKLKVIIKVDLIVMMIRVMQLDRISNVTNVVSQVILHHNVHKKKAPIIHLKQKIKIIQM